MKEMNTLNKNSKGQFIRKNNIWSITNQNEGWLDTDGRMWVYYTTHRKCNSNGYVRKCRLNESNTRGKYCSMECRRKNGK